MKLKAENFQLIYLNNFWEKIVQLGGQGKSEDNRLKKEFKALSVEEVQDLSAQEGWDVKYQQLEKGQFNAKFSEISSSRFLFSSESYSGKAHISGTSPTDFVSFGFSTVNSIYNGKLWKPSQIVYLPKNKEMDVVGSKDTEISVIYVPLEDIKRRIQYLDIDGLLDLSERTPIIFNNSGSHLFASFQKIKHLPFPKDKVGHNPHHSSELLFDQTLDIIIDDLVADFSNLIDASYRKLDKNYKRAKYLKEFMMNNLTTSLSITDMCKISGFSRRNLFYSFKEYYGTPPYNYFLLLRLNAIRNELLKARRVDVKIGDLIHKFNFYNFSDFSCLYKNTFGESPSITLTK